MSGSGISSWGHVKPRWDGEGNGEGGDNDQDLLDQLSVSASPRRRHIYIHKYLNVGK